jgi:hypothetical protein
MNFVVSMYCETLPYKFFQHTDSFGECAGHLVYSKLFFQVFETLDKQEVFFELTKAAPFDSLQP